MRRALRLWLGVVWVALTRPRSLRGAARARRSRGGIALLVVITTMLVLAVIVSELSYGSTVRLLVATHQRDRAQAVWLARSGVNIYRLILMASRQLEKTIDSMGPTISAALGLPEDTDVGAILGSSLWQMLPSMNTGMLRMIFASGGDASDVEEEDVAAFQQSGRVSDEIASESREGGLFDDQNFLDFDGDFSADVTDEESKINVNRLASRDASTPLQEDPTALQLYGLLSGQEDLEFLRDRNLDAWELVANLADWVDTDNTREALAGGGYEDNLYNRLNEPYVAKNAPFDTKEEIRLVEGWQDDVYERFAPSLTIYGSGKFNFCTTDDNGLAMLIRTYITPTPSPAGTQAILEQLQTQMAIVSMKPKELVSFLEGLGFTLRPGMAGALTCSSRVFTVQATGLVGDSSATITTVMDFTSASTGGRVLYWRED